MNINKYLNIKSILLSLIIINAVVFTAYGQKISTFETGKSKGMREIKLFFSNPNSPDFAGHCDAGEFVTRKIPATPRVADAALRLVFAGPTKEEKAKGMLSIAPLGKYYIGVSIEGDMAVINFRPGAEKYLYVNGPICMSEQWLAPMSETLKQFKNIKTVEYAINGKIIEDWDA